VIKLISALFFSPALKLYPSDKSNIANQKKSGFKPMFLGDLLVKVKATGDTPSYRKNPFKNSPSSKGFASLGSRNLKS